MNRISLLRRTGALICVCMLAGSLAGCSGSKAPTDTTDGSEEYLMIIEDIDLDELAETEGIDPETITALCEGYDPDADTDLEKARTGVSDLSLAGTIIGGQDISFTNSNLASYSRISPNKTVHRNHKIDTISIHCMAGQLTVETCGEVFSSTKAQASSNYGVGLDGTIALYVQEWDRSWCTSNSENDNRAVTIEVASDSYHPYAVNDKAYKATIRLVADICLRNGIDKLVWSDDKTTRIKHLNGANMTVHRDYANKACPGEYLYTRMGDIAEQVNKIIEKNKGKKISGRPCWEETVFESYLVAVTSSTTIRKSPSLKSSAVRIAKKNEVYTIVNEKKADNILWGKLKSGEGWINLEDTQVR